ncbi:hypothetical protein PR048_027653 [Dryococelus australis]|uniref:Uncharacterized protein n=1 Tax=Dryococelus australis TaxID=614101 RepID=A0ABQ9GH30_9NEOP|nr:hypothetical protein PR048_027653 [Dryococelus australis]
MLTHLKSENCHGLINIGTCNLHIVHNSFIRGMSDEIDDFLDVLFKFLHRFQARKEDFANIQVELGIEQQTMLRFVNNRWLSMVPAIARIREQWSTLREYFLKYILKKTLNINKQEPTIA